MFRRLFAGIVVCFILGRPACPARADDTCFRIEHIRVDGVTPSLAWMQHEAAAHEGECLGVKGINGIVDRLTEELLKRGLVTTRIRIPQQDLSGGDLHFEVTPGILHAIRFATPHHDATWRDAFPVRIGGLLNVRELEQGLEQMKRVPSQDVRMEIVPAANIGESDVVLDVRRVKPESLTLSINNAGTPPSPPLEGSLAFAWDNPLHLNDILSLRWNGTTAGGATGTNHSDSVYYSIPYRWWTYQFSRSVGWYKQNVAGFTQDFTLSGMTHSNSLGVSRILHRTQRVKTSASLQAVSTSSRSFVDDVEIAVQRHVGSYVEFDLTREANDGRNAVTFSVGLRNGLHVLGATPDAPVSGAPTSFYRMATLDASAAIPLSKNGVFRWKPHLHGQWAPGQTLYTSDQLSIGSRYTVRGFDGSQSLIAENGYYLQNDFEHALDRSRSLYLGIDKGQVWGPSTVQLAGKSLVGTVVGVRGQFARCSFDVFAGAPLAAPSSTRMKRILGFDVARQF